MGNVVEMKPPKAPDWLSEDGKEKFTEYARQLQEWGVWNVTQKASLAMMCHYECEWVRLAIEMEDEDLSIDDERGSQKRNPKASLMKQAFEHYTQLLQRFGFTPFDAQKITTKEGKPKEKEGKKVSFR